MVFADIVLNSLCQIEQRCIGQGCFGKVYKANILNSYYAIKVLPQRLANRDKSDVNKLRSLNHPNIIKTYAVCFINKTPEGIRFSLEAGDNFGILMELCTTDLFVELKNRTRLVPAWNISIISAICDGLEYLHGKNIIHFDLKPQNVLLKDKQVKLADFGLGGQGVFTGSSSYSRDPTLYMPPEVRKGSKYGTDVDIYSLGIIMLQLYSDYDSFFDWLDTLDRCKIEYDTTINIAKLYMPYEMIRLVEEMTKEPKNRPKLRAIKNRVQQLTR